MSMLGLTLPGGSNGTMTSGPTSPVAQAPGYPLKAKMAECDKDSDYDPEIHMGFSKGSLKRKMLEYKAGKYTKRYIETYLEFMHLNGIVDNLDYLEFKTLLTQE